ncbi:MAG: hypothetical protein JSR17_04860 [Proteobacteria bacterium]|nr:hypothetical protein [Pseudomonadota bacterium]
MRELSVVEILSINGGLTDKQVDSLLGKVGAYAANIGFLSVMFCAGYIGLPTLVIGGIGSSVVKVAGTYVVYENKNAILGYLDSAMNYFSGTPSTIPDNA